MICITYHFIWAMHKWAENSEPNFGHFSGFKVDILAQSVLFFFFFTGTQQSLYYNTRYNTVVIITRPGLGSQMVIFQL